MPEPGPAKVPPPTSLPPGPSQPASAAPQGLWLPELARLELACQVLLAIHNPGGVTRRRHPLGHPEARELWQTRAVLRVVMRALRAAAATAHTTTRSGGEHV